MICDRPPIRNVSTCCGQVRVYFIPQFYLTALLHQRVRIANLPGDADVIEISPVSGGLAYLVYSIQFQPIKAGELVPKVTAIIKRCGERITA